LVLLIPAAAAAHPRGQVGASGESGKACMQCHSGGASPRLQISGPLQLDPGARGIYTLTLQGGAGVVGGFDVSVGEPDAKLVATDRRTRIDGDELTHGQPLPFSSGTLTLSFDVLAPMTGDSFQIFAAGNSCNGDKTPTGDAASTATLSVTINGGVDDAPAGDRPPGGGGGQLPPRYGCSMSTQAAASGLAWWVLVGLLLVASRRTKRARR
jgi:MYXO-CTERM domain-containing protein